MPHSPLLPLCARMRVMPHIPLARAALSGPVVRAALPSPQCRLCYTSWRSDWPPCVHICPASPDMSPGNPLLTPRPRPRPRRAAAGTLSCKPLSYLLAQDAQ